MVKWILLTILLIVTSFGCTEQQLQQADEFIQDVNNIATGAQAVLQSPAGAALPPEWKLYGVLGIGLANALVITWQEWRNRLMKKTTKAIVKGIEVSYNPKKEMSKVKSNIAHEMLAQGGYKFYARANKIVDKLKIA